MASTITLHSLLETHDQPFCVIDASLRVIAVNHAYETLFARNRDTLVGQPCCHLAGDEHDEHQPCRHQRMFRDLEPYQIIHSVTDGVDQSRSFRVRGFPLVDSGSHLFLGESILPVGFSGALGQSAMAGECPRFRQLLERLTLAAGSLAPVLLEGETGTGKELAAQFIHAHSTRASGQLVVVDCTVLGEALFESELFGHERGAFTGSAGSKPGLFELAHQGTLFLDEIGELPLTQQPKLLRALESGSFRRVGGTETRKADVRVISASHRDLAAMVQAGTFRADLYYRLAVLPVAVPALRERGGDIPVIARHLLAQIGASVGRQLSLSLAAAERLQQHAFPGNIRELRNALQLAAALAPFGRIEAEHVVLGTRGGAHAATAPREGRPAASPNPLDELEMSYLKELLRRHHGNRKLAAEEMNVSERTFYRKLKRYHLNDAHEH
ncbi:sigma-54 interaction domain-containing protein [Methyloterricola oryzae]|uniref:sigma-54 interaction domain-containing protein n=1 Tax=Methyloterricola oryzae TaxID=1495050 RepID=UPI0005EBD86A|nr:sigma-54-dependent Fis family transcriptional regulator [Methyloterricola oryzae]